MAKVDIHSFADILAVEALDDPLLQIDLKRLEELSTARLSYNLLRQFYLSAKLVV
jgi:hypothetical protein